MLWLLGFILFVLAKKQGLHDPRAQELLATVSNFQGDNKEDVKSFLVVRGLLPDPLKNNVSFISNIQSAYADFFNTFKSTAFEIDA